MAQGAADVCKFVTPRAIQFERRGKKSVACDAVESPLTPELKEFVDRAIVPVLVKEYLAVTNLENELAEKDSGGAHFVSRTAAPGLRSVKP